MGCGECWCGNRCTFGLLAWFWPIARRQSGQQFQAVQQLVADARRAMVLAVEAARERGRREAQALVSERDEQLAAVEQKLHAVVGERERWKEAEMGRAGQTFPSRLAELREELDQSLEAAKQKHAESLSRVTEERDRRTVENREQYQRRCAASCAPSTIATGRRWPSDGTAAWPRFAKRWTEMEAECERLFPDWNVDRLRRPGRSRLSRRRRFALAQLTLDLAQVKNGIPQDERLRPDRNSDSSCRR